MTKPPPRDLAALMEDDALIDAAVAAAQTDAVRRHRLLGESIVYWRDGRVVVETTAPSAEPERADGHTVID